MRSACGLYVVIAVAANPALEKMLAEIPEGEEDVELRREISHAIELLDSPEPTYEPAPFDIFEQFPEKDLPEYDLLSESGTAGTHKVPNGSAASAPARLAASLIRSWSPKVRKTLFEMAKSDSLRHGSREAWESACGRDRNA